MSQCLRIHILLLHEEVACGKCKLPQAPQCFNQTQRNPSSQENITLMGYLEGMEKKMETIIMRNINYVALRTPTKGEP